MKSLIFQQLYSKTFHYNYDHSDMGAYDYEYQITQLQCITTEKFSAHINCIYKRQTTGGYTHLCRQQILFSRKTKYQFTLPTL